MNATERQITFINNLMTALKRHDWNAEYLYWLNMFDFSHLTDKQASRVIDILKSYNRAESLLDACLDNAEKAALFGEKAAAVVAFLNAALDKGVEFEDIQTAFMAYRSQQFVEVHPEASTLTAEECQAKIDYHAKFLPGLTTPNRLTGLFSDEYRLRHLAGHKAMMKEWQRGKEIAAIYGRYFPVHPNHFETAK